MPKKVFFELDEEKQNRIIEAATREFAQYGYAAASTNRLVRECGISKGSLFKYFESKEELYFYLIDIITSQRAEEMKNEISNLSKDLFERAIGYSVAEFSWYASNPVKGKLIIGMASESDPEISRKIAERYADKSNGEFLELMKDVDMSGFKSDKKEIINVIKWVMSGFNQSFLLSVAGQADDLEKIQKEYVRQLKSYLEILKKGL